MTNLSPSLRLKDIKYYAAGVDETITVSQNDTITCGDFVDTEALKKAVLMKNSDGTEVTNTVANNVIRVTGDGTSMECTLFVFGRRA